MPKKLLNCTGCTDGRPMGAHQPNTIQHPPLSAWQPRPTVTGWYWMRWRQKWGRQDSFCVVRFISGLPKPFDHHVFEFISEKDLSEHYLRAEFSGPLEPPKE